MRVVDGAAGTVVAGLLAIVAAFVYTAGLAFQQKGNLVVMDRGPEARSGWLAVVTNRWWAVGFAVTLGGFGLHAVALNLGALAVVQPLQVTQLVFMLPFSAWVAHVATRREDWVAALVVVAGLGGFLAAAQPGEGLASAPLSDWVLPGAILLAAVVVLLAAARVAGPLKAALLGTATGVLYGLQGATLKQATVDVADGLDVAVTSWSVYATIVVGVSAVIVQNLALRAGRLSSAQTTLTVMTPLASTFIGITVFAEPLETDPLRLGLTLVAVAVTFAGTARLARSPALVAADEIEAGDEPPGEWTEA